MRDRIEIIDIPANISSRFIDDTGNVTLDLPAGFTFQLTARLEELSDINKIEGAAVLGFDLPKTPKNDFLFKNFDSPNIIDNDFSPIEVRLMTAGGTVLPQNLLWVVGASDSNSTWKVEIVNGDGFWAIDAENTKLRDIDFGSFQVTEANLLANWPNVQWADGQDPFWFPLVHYGGFRKNPNEWSVEDFLPWLSIPATLKRGFSEIKWNVECPLFNTDWFNRLWYYALSRGLEYTNQGILYGGLLRLGGPLQVDNTVTDEDGLEFTAEIGDFGNNFSTQVSGTYGNVTVFEMAQDIGATMEFCMEGTVTHISGAAVTFTIRILDFDQSTIVYDSFTSITISPGESKAIRICKEIPLIPGQRVFFLLENDLTTGGVYELDGSFAIESRAVSERIYRVDTVNIAELISPDYSFLDFLKGVIHLCNLKVSTDWITRTVGLYPEGKTDVYNDADIEGFFLPYDQSIDVTKYVIPKSRNISFPRERPNRFLRLAFKRSTDDHIKDLDLPDSEPLYGRTIDLGEAFKKETKESRNPFFEPTANVQHFELSIPALWDNTNGEPSTDIGPRIMYAAGYFAQVSTSEEDAGEEMTWIFEDIQRTDMPFGAQSFDGIVFRDGGPDFSIDESVVYGEKTIDLYTMFYRFMTNNLRFAPTYDVLIYMDDVLFEQLNFRRRMFMQYGDEGFFAKLISKNDYRTNEDIPTPVTIHPDFQITDPES